MDLIQNGESSRSPSPSPPSPHTNTHTHTHTHANGLLPDTHGETRDIDGDVEMRAGDGDSDGDGAGHAPAEAVETDADVGAVEAGGAGAGADAQKPEGLAGDAELPGNGDAPPKVEGEGMEVDGDAKRGTARLIMPQWDVGPEKPVHASQDLISLLHLDTLYNAYVRPFTDVPPDEGYPNGGGGGEGQAGKRKGFQRRKVDKGYQHLIDDCIDPMPFAKSEVLSLLPLLGGVIPPPAPPPRLPEGPLRPLPDELFERARLEVGTQDGYHNHVKQGVREAEERRQRKALNRKSMTLDLTSPAIPSVISGRTPTPGTPLLPVAPPQRGGVPHPNIRRGTAPPGHGGVRPFPPAGGAGVGGGMGPGGRPFHPSSKQRPASLEAQGVYKKSKVGGSRSASPMPGGAGAGQMSQAQGQSGFPPNRGKRTGSADVQLRDVKRAKSSSRSASPMPGVGAGAGAGAAGWKR